MAATGDESSLLSSDRYETWIMPLIAEFVGMFMFTFIHCLNTKSLPIVGTALSHGLFVTNIAVIIGHISGCHINTAVTFGVTLAGGISVIRGTLYIITQLLGSLCGAGIATAVLGYPNGAFVLGAGVSIGQAVLAEIVMSSLLMLSVLIAAMERGSTNAPHAIGFAIAVSTLIGYHITGACMNPSLSFGPAVVTGVWHNYWIYWVAPLLGALLATVVYKVALANAANRIIYQRDKAD